MAHTFATEDLVDAGDGRWEVQLPGARLGRVLFDGSAEELLAELNGRQRARYGNALVGVLMSRPGLELRE